MEFLGREALKRRGKRAWKGAVREAVEVLHRAFAADYVVLGGGNAAEVDPLPPGARRGGNENAFKGGFRLWQTEVAHIDQDDALAEVWRVVY